MTCPASVLLRYPKGGLEKRGVTGDARALHVFCMGQTHVGLSSLPLLCNQFFLHGNRRQMGALVLVNKDAGDSLGNPYSF